MSRICELTGKRVMVGNKVSHANNKTRRRFLPNLCNVSFYSDVLQKKFKLRISNLAIRSVDKVGSIDDFLIKAKSENLAPKMQKAKSEILTKIENPS